MSNAGRAEPNEYFNLARFGEYRRSGPAAAHRRWSGPPSFAPVPGFEHLQSDTPIVAAMLLEPGPWRSLAPHVLPDVTIRIDPTAPEPQALSAPPAIEPDRVIDPPAWELMRAARVGGGNEKPHA